MLLNVQMLRALAALLVVAVHLEPLAVRAGLPPRALHFGTVGVDLFFVISGLIMVVTTEGARRSPAAFLKDRLTRVAPLYWTVTLIVFVLAALAPWAFRETGADPVFLLKSLAFVPYARPDGFVYPLLFVGWSLNYEMAFYLLFAIGLAVPSRALGLVATGALLLGAVATGALLRPADPLLRFYTDPMMLEFVGGMTLGRLLPRLRAVRLPGWLAVVGMAGALLAMLACGPVWPHARIWVVPASATAAVAAAIVAESRGLTFDQRWIQALGAGSYSIYLTHVFCTQAIVLAAARFEPGAVGCVVLAAAALVLVIVVGLATRHLLEVPLTRLARDVLASGWRWPSGGHASPRRPAWRPARPS